MAWPAKILWEGHRRWDGTRELPSPVTQKLILYPTTHVVNRWNTFKQEYNVSVIEETTELFHTLGLKDAGYNYILLDEGWSDDARTADGFLQANKSTFPDGMKELSSYIHSHGLKMGLYGDSGILTCGFKPGSWGYEERDAWTLADWDIDYWKYDNCGGFQAMTIAPQVRFSSKFDILLPFIGGT